MFIVRVKVEGTTHIETYEDEKSAFDAVWGHCECDDRVVLSVRDSEGREYDTVEIVEIIDRRGLADG